MDDDISIPPDGGGEVRVDWCSQAIVMPLKRAKAWDEKKKKRDKMRGKYEKKNMKRKNMGGRKYKKKSMRRKSMRRKNDINLKVKHFNFKFSCCRCGDGGYRSHQTKVLRPYSTVSQTTVSRHTVSRHTVSRDIVIRARVSTDEHVHLTWLLSISPEQKYSAGIMHRVDIILSNLLK